MLCRLISFSVTKRTSTCGDFNIKYLISATQEHTGSTLYKILAIIITSIKARISFQHYWLRVDCIQMLSEFLLVGTVLSPLLENSHTSLSRAALPPLYYTRMLTTEDHYVFNAVAQQLKKIGGKERGRPRWKILWRAACPINLTSKKVMHLIKI